MFSSTARVYDLLYGPTKDYEAEASKVADVIRQRHPDARTVLDVGCGTGEHARRLRALGFEVEGVDLEPDFVAMAREKNPGCRFEVADMTSLDMGRRYDAVINLFSSIGYVRTLDRLQATLGRMAAHLGDGGVMVVEPWFQPGEMTDSYVMTLTGQDADTSVVRMSRTTLDGAISTLHFEYLVGTGAGIQRFSETHELGLFTREEMEAAFRTAGLDVHLDPEGLAGKGLYVGRPAQAG